jgi:hypothetical protein
VALASHQPVYTVPTLAALCTEILSIHAPELLLEARKEFIQPVSHQPLPTFAEQVAFYSHAASTIERFSPHGIKDLAISSDGQQIIALDLNDRICARFPAASDKSKTLSIIPYTSGALVSPACDTVITGPLTNAHEHNVLTTPIQSKPIDCIASIEKLLSYTTLSGPYFIHTKTNRLCKIDDIGFNALIQVPTYHNESSYGWQLICRTPEVAHSYKTSIGASVCMYLTRVSTPNNGERLTDNARIINLNAYFQDSEATGVYLEHNEAHGPLCCFALSNDGTYAGIGYRGKSHIYELGKLFNGNTAVHTLIHPHSTKAIQSIVWHPDTMHIIAIDEHGTIAFHTATQSNAITHITPRAQCPFTMELNDARTHVAIGYGDSSVYVMPLPGLQHMHVSPVQLALFAKVYNYAKNHSSLEGIADICALLPKHIQKAITAWHPAITATRIAEQCNAVSGDMNGEQLVADENYRKTSPASGNLAS